MRESPPPERLIDTFLRVHPEPYRYFREREVHDLLTADPRGYLDYVRTRVQRIALDEATVALPNKQVFSDPNPLGGGGDFRVMPCVVRDGAQIEKTLKLVGTNRDGHRVPDQITVGKAFRLEPNENYITHIFEACLLSSARTGLCAAIAIDRLSRERKRVAILGAGRVGYYAGCYVGALPGVEEVVFSDPDDRRAELAVELLSASGLKASTARGVPLHADVVVLATTSTVPVLGPGDTDAPLVVSMGADIFGQRELSDTWIGAAELFTDTLDSLQVGDLRAWREAGLCIPAGELVPLLSLFSEDKSAPASDRRVFVSTGSALLDNLTISYLLSRAENAPDDRAHSSQ